MENKKLTFFLALMICIPVIPAFPADPWMDTALSPVERANALLPVMTQEEKLAIIHGDNDDPYTGHVPAITRLGIPDLWLLDGPAGVGHGLTQVTCFPAGMTAAATWDEALIRQYGAAIGAEHLNKGGNIALGPCMNMTRSPLGGRVWEGYGEDPYLSAKAAAAQMLGIQGNGIMAVAKHLIANEQETNRGTVNEFIDDRTLHEIYLPPFKACVLAGVDSAMCAYNKVNGAWCSENGDVLVRIYKKELGFTGFVMSDWWAVHGTDASANGGLDMEMPGSDFWAVLGTSIDNKTVPQTRLDDMVRRILVSMFKRGIFDRARVGSLDANVQSAAHTETALNVAADGIVLLKNNNNLLPLTSAIKSIAVIGSVASTRPVVAGGGSGEVRYPYIITALQGITARAGSGVTVRYVEGDTPAIAVPSQYFRTPGGATGLQGEYYNTVDFTDGVIVTRTDADVYFDWGAGSPATGVNADNFSVRWTGTFIPPSTGTYTLHLTSDDGSRLYLNDTLRIDNWGFHGNQTRSTVLSLNGNQSYSIRIEYFEGGVGANCQFTWNPPSSYTDAAALAGQSDVAIVVTGMTSAEGSDRQFLNLPNGQDNLITAVANANPRTIVVAYTPAQILMPWSNRVSSILFGFMPGQEAGNALAQVLYGDRNPGGKLPITIAANDADYDPLSISSDPDITYSEGLLMGYRGFYSRGVTPLYPFGHGLSYTVFNYSGLGISPSSIITSANTTVTFTVTNGGSRTGAEVAQLYLAFPASAGEPPGQLKGFSKMTLAAGESRQINLTLTPDDFSTWDSNARKWIVTPGTYQVMVGSSSRDIRLNGLFQVNSGGINAFTQIEAENYNSGFGIFTEGCSEGGSNAAYISNDDYLLFNNMDFGTGALSFQARVASAVSGGRLELHLDNPGGARIGVCMIPGTGGWQSWTTVSYGVSGVSGIHNLYMKCTGGNGDLYNINWFRFVAGNPIVSGAVYKLQPANASLSSLDVAGAGSADNTNVAIYTDNNSAAQQWQFIDTGGGYYRLIPQCATGLALNVTGGDNQDNTNVDILTINGSSAQEWLITSSGDGYYQLSPACAPGKCLDVASASIANGANVQIYESNRTDAQKWLIVKMANGTAPTSTPTPTPTPTGTATSTRTPTPITVTATPTPTSAGPTDITNLGGTITAQYYDSPSGEEIDKLFDNSSSTKYLTFHASGWVQFQAGASYVVTQYTVTSANDYAERDPLTWTFQGSANGTSWATLDSRSGEDFPNRFQLRTFSFNNSASYNYYRLNMTNNSGTILQLAEWEIFGAPGTVNTATPTRTPTPTPTTANTATPTRTPTPTPTSVTAGFTDNFNDNSIGSAWTMYSGSWTESGTILRQDSTSQGDPCKAIVNGSGLNLGSNQTITAKVYINTWTDGDSARAGVSLFTGTGDGRGYNLLFHNNHSTIQWLDDMVAWGTSYTFIWSNQTWYWFKMKMENGTLYGRVWQDGSAEPANWPYTWVRSGRTGYPALNGGTSGHGGSCAVFFDDVRIEIP